MKLYNACRFSYIFAGLFLMVRFESFSQITADQSGGCSGTGDGYFTYSGGTAGTSIGTPAAGCVQLEDASNTFGYGAVYMRNSCTGTKTCADLTKSFTFSACLNFGTNTTTGDGFAFVIAQDNISVTDPSSNSGGNIGFASSKGPYYAMKFDDFSNAPEPAFPFGQAFEQAITGATTAPTSISAQPALLAGGAEVRTGSCYTALMSYNGSTNIMTVSFNGSVLYSYTLNPAIYATPTCVSIGITSSTGGIANQVETACAVTFNQSTAPISLLSFSGEQKTNGVKISWSTAQEINNKEFTIMRSSDAQNWETIAEIPGAGNSSSILNYSVTDITAPFYSSKTIYYKIMQTDFDGKWESFPPIMVSAPREMVQVIPNPNDGQFKIFIGNSALDEMIIYKIISIQGQEVYSASIKTIENIAFLDAGNLDSGIYYLNFISNGKVYNEKIIIAR